MKRIAKYFWHSIRSSFKHKIGQYYEKVDGVNTCRSTYYNIWTNKTWIK